MREHDDSWLTMRRAEVIGVEMNVAQLREEAARLDLERAKREAAPALFEYQLQAFDDVSRAGAAIKARGLEGWRVHTFSELNLDATWQCSVLFERAATPREPGGAA